MENSKQSVDTKKKIIREKHHLIPELMKEFGIHCWMVFARETTTTPDSVMKFVVGNDVVLQSAFIFGYIGDSFRKIAIVANFDALAQKENGWWDEVIGYEQGMSEHLLKIIGQMNPKNIALDYSINSYSADGLSHGMYLILEKMLSNYKERFISAEHLIGALRGRKTETEIKLIRKACEITEKINQKLTSHIKVGHSETEVQELFYREMRERHLEPSWQIEQCPAVDAGPDKEFGHVGPQATSIVKKGHLLHNDFGVYFQGYCSDIQRLWFFGKKVEVPEELRHAIDTIITGIQIAADSIKPGVIAYEIDAKVRKYIVSRGYEEFMHGLGHQVGTEAHDGGTLIGPLWERYGDIPKGKFEVNQVYTLEPSIKTKNFGMVSLEEDIVVTKDGCEFLVPPAKDFIFIEN